MNKDCDNDDEENRPLPLALPLIKPKARRKSKSKKKHKSKTNKKCKRKANNDDDNSKYTHDNYNPSKPYVYHVDCFDSDKSYECTPINISEANRHAAKFSLSRWVKLSVDNLCNIAFPNSLLDEIVV